MRFEKIVGLIHDAVTERDLVADRRAEKGHAEGEGGDRPELVADVTYRRHDAGQNECVIRYHQILEGTVFVPLLSSSGLHAGLQPLLESSGKNGTRES